MATWKVVGGTTLTSSNDVITLEHHKAQFNALYNKTKTFDWQDSEALLDHLKRIRDSYFTLRNASPPFPANEARINWAGSVLVTSGALSYVSDLLVTILPDITSAMMMSERGKWQKSVYMDIGLDAMAILSYFAYWSQQVCEAQLQHPTLLQRVVSTLDEWDVQGLSGEVNGDDFAKWLLWLMRNISRHDSCTEALRGVPGVEDMLKKYATQRTVSGIARGASQVTLAALAKDGEPHLVITAQSLVESLVNGLLNDKQREEATKTGFSPRLTAIRDLSKNQANAEHVVSCGGLQSLKMVLEKCQTQKENQVLLDVLLNLSAVVKNQPTIANDVDLMMTVITSYEDSSSDDTRDKAKQVLTQLRHHLENSPKIRMMEGILASLGLAEDWEIHLLDDWRRADTNWRPITGEDETDGWTSLHLACYYNRFYDIEKYVRTEAGKPKQETSQAEAKQDATSSSEQTSLDASTSTEQTPVNATSSEQNSLDANKETSQSKASTSKNTTNLHSTDSPKSVEETSDQTPNQSPEKLKPIKFEYPPSNINTQTEDGETPLLVACQQGHVRVVRNLLRYKDFIDVNLADNRGKTPLFVACEKGKEQVVETLLQNNLIDVNHADNRGKTPMFVACEQGNELVIRELLKFDFIDVSRGQTPLGIAKEKGHLKVVSALESFMADSLSEQLKNTTLTEAEEN